MGCDIHMYIEKKDKSSTATAGSWIPAQGFLITSDEDEAIPDVPFPDQFSDRDYLLFGLLAGVRDPTNQVFEPKGFPEDASPEVRAVFERWGRDAHTPSFLTLEELEGIPWDTKMIKIERVFPKKDLAAFNKSVKDGKPDYGIITTWCSWTSQPDWEFASIEIPIKYEFKRFYDYVFWLNSYDYRCKKDEIRIVFWFEN